MSTQALRKRGRLYLDVKDLIAEIEAILVEVPGASLQLFLEALKAEYREKA